MGRTNAEAPSPSSRGNGRTGRENENTTVTRPATCEDRWCSRLTMTGEPGTPAGDSRRGRFALKPGMPCKGENLPLGLDFGELIEGTENGFLPPICPQSVRATLSTCGCNQPPSGSPRELSQIRKLATPWPRLLQETCPIRPPSSCRT